MNMNDMFADIIKKAIPPQVANLLTEENVKRIGDQATAFITDLRQSLERIELMQTRLDDKLDNLLSETHELKGLVNVNSHSDTGSKRKRIANGSGDGIAN